MKVPGRLSQTSVSLLQEFSSLHSLMSTKKHYLASAHMTSGTVKHYLHTIHLTFHTLSYILHNLLYQAPYTPTHMKHDRLHRHALITSKSHYHYLDICNYQEHYRSKFPPYIMEWQYHYIHLCLDVDTNDIMSSHNNDCSHQGMHHLQIQSNLQHKHHMLYCQAQNNYFHKRNHILLDTV